MMKCCHNYNDGMEWNETSQCDWIIETIVFVVLVLQGAVEPLMAFNHRMPTQFLSLNKLKNSVFLLEKKSNNKSINNLGLNFI